MENINRKQALRRALEEGGIFYVGAGADELNGKCCCLVLMRIASLLRADRLAAGVRAGAALLGGHIYSERQVFRGLAALVKSGIVRRERDLAGTRGTTNETPAVNYISAQVIDLAIEWAVAWRRGSPRPTNCVIHVPTLFEPYLPAKQALARVLEGQHDKLTPGFMTNCHTDLDTPPAPARGGTSPSASPCRGQGHSPSCPPCSGRGTFPLFHTPPARGGDSLPLLAPPARGAVGEI